MAVVGSAHVVIRALTDKLQDDIQKGLQASLPAANAVGRDMGREISDGVSKNMSPDMSAFERDMDNTSRRVGKRAGKNINDGITDGSKRGFSLFNRNASSAGGRGGKSFFSAFNRGGGSRIFVSMALRIAALLPLLAALGGAIGAVVNGLFLMGYAASKAVSSVMALAGALSALVQAGIVGLVAFKGVGEAVSAGTKLAAEEAAGSGKDMADAAQDAARAVRNAAEAVADAERNAARAIRDAQRAVRNAKEALARTYTDTHFAMRDAIEGTSDAEEAHSDAIEALDDAQRALNDAYEEAADRLQDLQFQSREGAIAEQRAVLALEDALYRLNATENLPSDNRTRIEAILAYQEAQLNLEEVQANNQQTAEDLASSQADSAETISDAQESVNDAQESASDAARDYNDAIRDQIQLQQDNARAIRDAREALQLAREALADAMREGPRSIRDAKEALQEAKEAQLEANKALEAGSPAANAYAEAMAKLSPAAQSFVKYLISIKGELQALKFAAQEGMFPGLERGLRTLVEGPMFPALERMMFSTGKAIGNAAAQIARDMSSGPFQTSFGRVTEFNAKLIRQMGRIFGDLAVVVVRVLDAGRPLTKMFMNWVEGLTSGWRETLNTKDGMEDLGNSLDRSGRRMAQLWRITKNLWEGFGDLGRVGRKSGKGLLDSFEDATKSFAKFTDTKAKREELRTMFADTADNLRAIGTLILQIGGVFSRLGANPAIKRTMEELKPVIENIEKLMTDMLENSGTGLINLVDRVVVAFQKISEAGAIDTFVTILTTAVNLLIKAFETPVLGAGLKFLLQIGAAMYAISILRKFPGVGLLTTGIKKAYAGFLKFKGSVMFTRIQLILLEIQTRAVAAATRVHQALLAKFPRLMKLVSAASKLMFGPWGLAILAVVGIFILLYKKVDWFRAAVNFVCRKVVDAFNWIVDGAKHLWDVLFGHSIFPDIVDGFKWFFDIAAGIFKGLVKFFTETIPNAAQSLLDFLKNNWPIILAVLTGPIGIAILLITKNWDKIKSVFSGVVDWVRGKFSAAWDKIKDKIIKPVDRAKDKLGQIFGAGGPVRKFFTDIKNWITGKFSSAWNTIREKLLKPIYDFEMKVLGFFGPGGTVRKFFTDIRDWIITKFIATWDKIKDKLTNPISAAVDAIKGFLNNQKNGLQWIFQQAVNGISLIWKGLQTAVKAPVKFVIETVYNQGLRKALNLIPGVDLGEATLPKGFAQGGVLPGFTPGRDVHQFTSPTGGRLELSGGEAIMRPEWTRAVGGPKAVERMNKAARQTRAYATGGVFPVPGGSVTNVHDDYGHYAVDINKGSGRDDYGAPVVANQAGTVNQHYVGDKSYGRWIVLDHMGGGSSLYAHLSAFNTANRAFVTGGMQIGAVGDIGNTGTPPGPHLHFELSSGSLDGAAAAAGYKGPTKAEKEEQSWKDLITAFPGAIKGAVSNIKNMGDKFGAWGTTLMGGMDKVGEQMVQAVNDKIPNKIKTPGPLPDIPMVDDPLEWPFDKGGIANGKGWMAKNTIRPERTLDPNQTALFERMVRALEAGGSDGFGGGDMNLAVHVPQDASARDVVEGIVYEWRRLQRGGRYQ